MLRAAIAFFLIGLFAMLFGAFGVAGVSFELGRLLLFVFIGLALIGFVAALVTGGRAPRPIT